MEAPSERYRDLARRFRALTRAPEDGAFEPATAPEIVAAEAALGCRLPTSYRWFQLEFGSCPRGPLDVYTVTRTPDGVLDIVEINQREREDDPYPPLPPHLIAFSDTGGGDLCCFDTSATAGGECPVVWWDHEGDASQRPEPRAPSFLDWLDGELTEIAAERPGSLLDDLGHVYIQWMREWWRRG